MDVFCNFLVSYNNTVHSSIGMAPSLVSDKDVLRIWKRMRKREAKIKSQRSTHLPCGTDGKDQKGEDAIREGIRSELNA